MKPQIVLIDDDRLVNFINTNLIKKEFPEFEIIEFTNPQDGLKYLKDLPCTKNHIVLLDINMPVLNGWQFLERLEKEREEFQGVIHMLSSSISPSDIAKAKEAPLVKSFISKPLKKEHFEIIFSEKTH
ncbi:MAG: response regulator [Luteibaculum sp.]